MRVLALTLDDDQALRRFAKALSPEDGEDAYHNALVQVFEKPPEAVRSLVGFLKVATVRALFKIWRHQKADSQQSAAYIADAPTSYQDGLALGRLPQTHCRRGHLFTPDNIKMVGPRRTCRICYRVADALSHKRNRRTLSTPERIDR